MGFAYRDFGGLKLHTPTLAKHGHEVKSSPPGSLILTNNMRELYENCHHTIFQSHLNQLIQALHLRKRRAWGIVREEVAKELDPERNEPARGLYEFLMQDTVPLKCFLKMKMEGLYRDVHLAEDRCLLFLIADSSLVYSPRCAERDFTMIELGWNGRKWCKSRLFTGCYPFD